MGKSICIVLESLMITEKTLQKLNIIQIHNIRLTLDAHQSSQETNYWSPHDDRLQDYLKIKSQSTAARDNFDKQEEFD